MASANFEQTLKQLQIKLIDSVEILENDDHDGFVNILEEVKDTAKNIKLWGFYCFVEEIVFFYKESKDKLDLNNSIYLNRKKLLEISIDSLLEYTKGISNGLYDIPIFNLVTLDLLRYNLGQNSSRPFSLYTQSSFFLKSLEKNNISSFRSNFSATQRMKLINSIEFLEYFYDFNFTVKDYDYQKAIKSCLVLTSEFKGTQHEILWNFCYIIFNFLENNDFGYLDRLFFTYVFNEIIRNYSNVLENMSFDAIEGNINKILASLSYLLQKYNNRDFIDNLTKQKLIALIKMPQDNTLDSIIKFRNHIDFKEISVITLDFYAELDLCIGTVLEDNKKKKIDLSDILDTLIKQQNSFVVIGYYQYWFEYTNSIKEINSFLNKDNCVETKNFNKVKDILFNLLELVAGLQKSTNNMDNLPFCISIPDNNKKFNINEQEITDAEIIAKETFNKNNTVVLNYTNEDMIYDNAIVHKTSNQVQSNFNNIDTEKLKEVSVNFAKINNHILMLEKVVKQINCVNDSINSPDIKNALNVIAKNAKDLHNNIKQDINLGSENFHEFYEKILDTHMLDSVKSLINPSTQHGNIRILIYKLNKEQNNNKLNFYELENNQYQEIDYKIISEKYLIKESIDNFKPNLLVFEVNKSASALLELFGIFENMNFSKNYPVIVLGDCFTQGESVAIIENGASVYLQKPFDINKFIKMISIVTNNNQVANLINNNITNKVCSKKEFA